MYFSTHSGEEVITHAEHRGEAHFFQADFFEKDWAGSDAPSQYDLVYDYTVSFCACLDNSVCVSKGYIPVLLRPTTSYATILERANVRYTLSWWISYLSRVPII